MVKTLIRLPGRLLSSLKLFMRMYRIGRLYNVGKSCTIGAVKITGKSLSIGKGTYMNSGYISCGNSSVEIGTWCAIGYNVSLVTSTHDVNFPTGPEHLRPLHEASVKIGNGVWGGNKVFVLPGVDICDFAVIGAKNVVNKSIPAFAVAVGIPAHIVKIKSATECKEHITFVEQNS
jgi:acetyltransferase-like isoleucine patch superfamily enzyme